MITISYDEYEKHLATIDQLRSQIQNYQTEIKKLKQEISFLKDSGENILVIIKDKNKPDVYEYKSNEKNILIDLVSENSKIRESYDELLRKIENQKHSLLLQISKLEEYIKYLENRGFLDRIFNKKRI